MWTKLRTASSLVCGFLVLLAGGPAYSSPVRPTAQDQPAGTVSSLGFVSGVLTDQPFYLGGQVATVDVTIRNNPVWAPIFGLLELHILPDDDPLGGGGEQEGAPIYSGTRVVNSPPGSGATGVVERFYVPLPAPATLYHAVARWKPAGAIDFDEPVATRFGVRPDIPEVPEEILTFSEVTVNVPGVRAALKAGQPLATGACAPTKRAESTQSPTGAAGLVDGKLSAAPSGGSILSPGENTTCGWEMRLPPDPVFLPIDASRSVKLSLERDEFVKGGVPGEPDVEFFKGTQSGEPGTDVRMTVTSDSIRVAILDAEGNSTYIEPLTEYAPNSPPDRYLVYSSVAVRLPSGLIDRGVESSPAPILESVSESSDLVRPESHTTDPDLFRILRVWVYRDVNDFSRADAVSHIWDLAAIFERELKIKVEPVFFRDVNSDSYDSNDDIQPDCGPFLDGFRDDTSGDDWNFLNLDARILFTDNPDINYCLGPDAIGWDCVLGCGGPTDGSGTSRTRAAYVWHHGSRHRVRQVAAHELAHTLGAGHDNSTIATHRHCACFLGACICINHDMKSIMVATYPSSDSHAVGTFTDGSRTQVEANADELPQSLHFISGNSLGSADGLTLKMFQMRHESACPGHDGWYKSDYRIRNTSGGLLSFRDLHFAFEPDGSGTVSRMHTTDALNFPNGVELTMHSGFETGFPGADGWCQMEVWPSYRMDDGGGESHFGPDHWMGFDFEIDAVCP